jgi:hypothetical protein
MCSSEACIDRDTPIRRDSTWSSSLGKQRVVLQFENGSGGEFDPQLPAGNQCIRYTTTTPGHIS